MGIGERVTEHRRERGWTQADLARESGVSQATISRLESGHISSPRADVLGRLASALRIAMDALVHTSYQLSLDDYTRRDPQLQAIFSGYERLPEDRKRQLADFVQWLEHQEEEERGKRGTE